MPRRDLERHEGFDEVSPEVGELDEAAFDDAMAEDADEALSMLADMTGATDERLRAMARRLAARVVVDLTRTGRLASRGVGRPRTRPADLAVGDLDVDASLDALVAARASGGAPDLEDLRVQEWAKPGVALCLVLDTSGSMGGARLAAAALATAAAALRAPADHSVLAFSDRVIVVKSQDVPRAPEAVVDDVFCLRGHGPTDLSLALTEARVQLNRSDAKRRVTVLLSDCDVTVGEDPVAAARLLDELVVIAPADQAECADALASEIGAKVARIAGPSDVPGAFLQLLGA